MRAQRFKRVRHPADWQRWDVLEIPARPRIMLGVGAGSSDNVEVYREGSAFYVLVTNFRLGYVGLEVYDLRWFHKTEPGSNGLVYSESIVFFQDPSEALAPLRKPWYDYSSTSLVRMLRQWEGNA